MNIDGIQIPTYFANMIADHMAKLIAGGMAADVNALHYAVALANHDVQEICMEMLIDDRHDGAIRDAIAAEVYDSLQGKAVA